MESSDAQYRRLAQAAGCALALCGVTGAGDGEAASAAGTATATVVAPAVVVIVVPPVFPGTVVTIESYTNSLSTVGPVLRAPSPPPATSGADGGNGGAAPGAPTILAAAGPGMVPPAASVAAVTVTRRADGALAVSGGSTLTFSVSEPAGAGTITIEYN